MTNKKIWIWGDSWAEPIHDNPLPNSNPSGHIETLLKNKGYIVTNFGKSGEDNLYSINLAKKSKDYPDYVIWFHTECFRTKEKNNKKWYIEDTLKNLSFTIYTEAAQLLDKIKSKLILIEGQSVVEKTNYKKILKPYVYHFIEDWRSQLIGRKLPECHFISCWHHLEYGCKNTLEEKSKILDAAKIIQRSTEQSHLFPDGGHPGNIAHTQLLETIEQIINK